MLSVVPWPPRRPNRVRVYWALPTGARILLYEQAGLGFVFDAIEKPKALPAAPPPRRARRRPAEPVIDAEFTATTRRIGS